MLVTTTGNFTSVYDPFNYNGTHHCGNICHRPLAPRSVFNSSKMAVGSSRLYKGWLTPLLTVEHHCWRGKGLE